MARTDQKLRTLAATKRLSGEFRSEMPLTNGWRIGSIHHGEPDDDKLMALVAETGAAVLVAEVAGSDFAIVVFASPDHPIARFVLHPNRAEAYDYQADPADQEAAPAALVSWAGGAADETEVTNAVNGDMVFVEDSLVRLAGALGAVPVANVELSEPPPAESERAGHGFLAPDGAGGTSDDISAFLYARIHDDEMECAGYHFVGCDKIGSRSFPCTCRYPERVARQADSRGRILAYLDVLESEGLVDIDYKRIRQLFALPYDDHPDYRQEWRR